MKAKPISRGVKLTLLFLADLLLLGASLLVFALFHHVLSKPLNAIDTDSNISFSDLTQKEDSTSGSGQTANLSDEEFLEMIDAGKRYAESRLPKRTVTDVRLYRSDDIEMAIRKVEYGSGNDKVTYFVSDVFVTSAEYIRTALAVKDGKLDTDYVTEMAEQNDALFAVSGDYFRNSEVGYVIRNGTKYRDIDTSNDICLLYADGEMECVSGKSFSSLKIRRSVWQAWSFGPSLLTEDGLPKTKNSQFDIHGGGTYHNTNEHSENGVYAKHPRNFIGYVEPGHYLFITVDGRDDGYSCGVTFIDESQIAYDEGCSAAYNLDGGRSAMMVFDDEMVNESYKDGRPISDCIYIAREHNDDGSGAASEE